MNELKKYATATLHYLGDAAHRRLVSVVVAMIATKLIGHAVAADEVANYLELIVGGIGGAWSSRTPRVES